MTSISARTTQKVISTLSLVLFALGFIVSTRYAFNWDLTQNKRYTLSPASYEVLGKLTDNVIINYYVSPAIRNVHLFPSEINNFLEVYAAASPYLIYREWDESTVSFALSEIGLKSRRTTIQEGGRPQTLTYYSGIELLYAGKRALVPFADRTEDLEYTLTTALERIVTPFTAKVGVSLQEPNDTIREGFKGLMAMLSSYNAQEIALDESLNPVDTPLIILIGSSLMRGHHVDILDNYLTEGGALLFAGSGTNLDVLQAGGAVVSLEKTPFLTWLQELGVALKPNLILDSIGATTINAGTGMVAYPAIISLVGGDLNQRSILVNGLTRLVSGWTSSLSLEPRNFSQGKILLSSSPEGIAMEQGINAEPTYVLNWLDQALNSGDLSPESYPLAASLRIDTSDMPWQNPENERRLVLVASRYAFHDALLPFGGQNLDLLVRSVDWLLKRDHLVGLKKERVITTWNFKTALSRISAHERVLFVNAFLLPIILVGLGLYRLIKRRTRSRKGETL